MIRAITSFKPNYANVNSSKGQNKSKVSFGSYTPLLGNSKEALLSRKNWGDVKDATCVKPFVDLSEKAKKMAREGGLKIKISRKA